MTTTNDLATKLQAAIAHVQENPAAARATYRAKVALDGGTQCSAVVRKFDPIIIDEPPGLGGNDAGPNPVEVLLASLGACQQIVYSLYASMMGIELDAISVKVKGQLDVRGFMGEESVPPGYQTISWETRIESAEDPEKIKQLVEIVEARCPTLDTLRRPVDVQGKALLNGAPIAAA